MCSVRFFCPTHERPFDCGFEVDENTFRQHRLSMVAASCPWCGKTHRFLLGDAHVDLPVLALPVGVPLAPELAAAPARVRGGAEG